VEHTLLFFFLGMEIRNQSHKSLLVLVLAVSQISLSDIMDKAIHIDGNCELCHKPAIMYYEMITVPAPKGYIPLCVDCIKLFVKFAGQMKLL
jgi:hypothetical protein